MGKGKLAALQRLFEPPPHSPTFPPRASPHCLMLWWWGGAGGRAGGVGDHFYALLSKCCVYIAEGGPLCVPLQISRSKRGKHGYINKRSLLTAPSLAPVTHLGFSSTSEWREKCCVRELSKLTAAAACNQLCFQRWKGLLKLSDLEAFHNYCYKSFALILLCVRQCSRQLDSEVPCTPEQSTGALAAKAKLLSCAQGCKLWAVDTEIWFWLHPLFVFGEWVKRERFNRSKSLPGGEDKSSITCRYYLKKLLYALLQLFKGSKIMAIWAYFKSENIIEAVDWGFRDERAMGSLCFHW